MSALQKRALIFLLMAGISYLHYTTKMHHPLLHLAHRELYLLPIFLAAYWFGRKWGLIISIIASFLFLPWAFITAPGEITYHINNVIHVLMYNLVAYIVGLYHDARVSHFTSGYSPKHEALEGPIPEHGRNILLCIDNSSNALKTAKYLADHFSPDDTTKVTILGIIREPSSDLYRSQEEWEEAKRGNESTIAALIEKARDILIKAGFPNEALESQALRVQKESIAGRIIEERERAQYDTIVIGATRMSKTQEFLFGNLAVKLVREAPCPVITVN